ncbi:MAG: TIGR01777 family oxidoreductase [Puniceicoccaceae bacterium]
MQTFTSSVPLPVSADEAFAWHEQPGAFNRLQPPWERVLLEEGPTDGLKNGSRVQIKTWAGPISSRWKIRHDGYRPGVEFIDEMEAGPFKAWKHWHRFHKSEGEKCRLEDFIRWELPLPFFSEPLLRGWVSAKLERMFAYRHAITAHDLGLASSAEKRVVLVAGGSGLIGRSLVPLLQTRGHEVRILSRQPKGRAGFYAWNPEEGSIDRRALEGVDAVVNLAGENIAQRWSSAARQRILSSRVEATKTLVRALGEVGVNGDLFLSASGVGFYGTNDVEQADEAAPLGEGFLAAVCRDWEAEALEAGARFSRVVLARLGLVLTPAGGALSKMLPAFLGGLGGRIGSGNQPMSVIGIEDVVQVFRFLIEESRTDGAVNLCLPNPVSNREFVATLGRVLKRPTAIPLPGWAVKTLFGEMGEATLLAGTGAVPRVLLKEGYRFRQADLEGALRFCLGRLLKS